MRTPRPVPERKDLKGLSLSPTDGFVLSRVDGTLSEHDLAASTGLPEERVQTSLAALEAVGLITFDNSSPATAASSPVTPPKAIPPPRITPLPSSGPPITGDAAA